MFKTYYSRSPASLTKHTTISPQSLRIQVFILQSTCKTTSSSDFLDVTNRVDKAIRSGEQNFKNPSLEAHFREGPKGNVLVSQRPRMRHNCVEVHVSRASKVCWQWVFTIVNPFISYDCYKRACVRVYHFSHLIQTSPPIISCYVAFWVDILPTKSVLKRSDAPNPFPQIWWDVRVDLSNTILNRVDTIVQPCNDLPKINRLF